jgi:AraC family transcriptional regulator of adaptative response/methylated-DNA-[protein]-cysteine methyltransferase
MSSPSSLHQDGNRPAAGRRAGIDLISFWIGDSSLGRVLVALSERGVRAVLIADDDDELRQDLRRRFPRAQLHEEPALSPAAAAVLSCVEGEAEGAEVAFDLRGTEFQRDVWRALRSVPAGQTISYKQIAERLGRPTSVRAVGQAVSSNPIAVLVPCHRAIRHDGSLSGYRWGVERKRELLAREAASVVRAEV